jgi:hypothetical protein
MVASNLPGWIALATFTIAAGSLLRSRLWSDSNDPRSELLTESTAAIVASVTLGSLPRLFGLESELLRWCITGVSAVLVVFSWMQLIRVIRLKKEPVE